MLPRSRYWLLLLTPLLLPAQERGDLQQILDRLDRLERENHALADEVRALRSDLGLSRAPAPVQEAPVEERVAVAEQRTVELSQSKVESGQRLPLTLD